MGTVRFSNVGVSVVLLLVPDTIFSTNRASSDLSAKYNLSTKSLTSCLCIDPIIPTHLEQMYIDPSSAPFSGFLQILHATSDFLPLSKFVLIGFHGTDLA